MSASGTLHLRSVAQKTMPERYRIPFPDVQLDRKEETDAEAKHLRGLWHELAQHLVDLSYLSEASFLAYHAHKKHILDQPTHLLPIVDAVSEYVQEEDTWPEKEALLPTSPGQIDLFWLRRHLGTVTEQISRYTAWDGSLPTPMNYRVGTASCYGRSLAYRLRTLSSSQFPFAGTSWFSANQLGDLQALFTEGLAMQASPATDTLPNAWWTVLNNVDELLRLYLGNAPRRDQSALLYQLPKPAVEGIEAQIPLEQLSDRDFRSPRINPRYYHINTARRIIRNARRRQNRLDDGLDVRLLQVKLWQTSYYVGAIDGEWGQVSHRALLGFLAEAAENVPGSLYVKGKRKIRSLVIPANTRQGVYAADLKGIIRLFTDSRPASLPEFDPEVNENALDNLRRTAGISEEQLDAKVLGEDHVNNLYPDILEKPARRVSFPRDGLLSRIWSGVRRIFRWLADRAKSLIEDILGPVFSFIKLSLRKIRMAVQRFFEGFKYLANFLFGRPVVTEVAAAKEGAPPEYFATRFSLDFDGTTLAPLTFARGGAAEHAAHLVQMRDNMFYFIDSVIWIIRKIGQLTNPGGWVWLGWEMVRGFLRRPN